ncbi:hypothetical protein OIDMADRAFT_169760, partial [Oidiodendron maius Zn]
MEREVRVNNERIWVTQNLYHALASLRYEKETRVLWVDAICINQVDNAEREAQVPQMRNIYGSANRVVVWLGTTPFGSKRAFEIAGKDNPPHYYHYGTVRLVSQLLSSPWWIRNIDESQQEDTTLIQADYTTEPSTIFSDCTAKLINTSRSLFTVALAECVSDGQELDKRPTWCPKWDELGNDFRAVPFWIGGKRDDEGRCPWIDSQFTA